jgi:hypothetical protein
MLLKYDREELYQKVWERPMLKVAEEYGVSSVALGKVCRKLAVPVPGRGHWAKLAYGHTGARKLPLPKLDPVPVIYRSRVAEEKAASSSNQKKDPEFAALDQLLSSGALVPQPTDASVPAKEHVLIRRTASRLRSQSRKTDEGILIPREPGGLDVKVSAGTLDRALQVMSQVLAVLEAQGFSVEVSEEGGTAALIHGRRVSFGIEEEVRRIVTRKPRVPNPTDRWDYDEIVTNEATGVLALMIHTSMWPTHSLRKKWSDAKIQRVEKLIPDFIAGLMRTAIVLRRDEEEKNRRELEQQQRERERAELRKQIEAEEAKVAQLDQWSKGWEEAERLRRFIAAYAEKAQTWPPDSQPKHKAWIEWATREADRHDPFVKDKPTSVLDRKHELRGW